MKKIKNPRVMFYFWHIEYIQFLNEKNIQEINGVKLMV